MNSVSGQRNINYIYYKPNYDGCQILKKEVLKIMEEKILDILSELGVSFNLLGRQYIVRAVMLVYQNGRMSITKEIYPQLAKEFDTKNTRVERAIRNAIEKVFTHGSTKSIEKYFGLNVNHSIGKLTNSEFIYGLVEYLKRNK